MNRGYNARRKTLLLIVVSLSLLATMAPGPGLPVARGEIWLGSPAVGSGHTLYFADAVCLDDPVTGSDCDQDTQVPALDAVRPAAPPVGNLKRRLYLPITVADSLAAGPTITSTPEPGSEQVPPLYFFYAIHTHVQGDWWPYTDSSLAKLDTTVADNMLATIRGIAAVLDRHGAKGTWEVVYGTSKGLCTYQGENNIFRQLQEAGHEVAVHTHRNQDIGPAFHNLQEDCGITPQTTSGFMAEAYRAGGERAQEVVSQAIVQALELGMNVGTSNLAPGGNRNPFGALCNNQLGVGNDMWPQTGNLMFPWRPDYLNQNICADSPRAALVLVDHVPISWMAQRGGMPDVLGQADFRRLQPMFDAALDYLEQNRPQRVAAWGFVTHVTEYAAGNQAENPPDAAALNALDRFLDYVDTRVAEGRVIYATAGQIARLAFPGQEEPTPTPSGQVTPTLAPPPSGHTYHDVDRLDDGHTLITDGGPRLGGRPGRNGPTDGVEQVPGCRNCSRVVEVDQEGHPVWSFQDELRWAHNADRLPNGNTLISDTGHDRVIQVDAAGNVVWNSDDIALSDGSHLRYPNDANRLSNDHLLITDRDNHRVIEIQRDGTIVWQFGETGVPGSDTTHLNGPHNADRLPTGNTIIADSVNRRVIEVAPDGTIVWQYEPRGADALNWPRDADRLESGNTLITDSRNNRVIEVTPAGRVVWQYTDLNLPYDADRLPDGHTLISGAPGGGVIEVDEAGTVVWRYPPEGTRPPTSTPPATATPTPSVEAPPTTTYEPPIQITFNIHFDPVLASYDTWRERKDNLLWLQSFVESYDGVYQPKLNLQLQGDQAEFYLDPQDPEAAEGRAALQALYQAGHTFGTHAHNIIRGQEPHSWHVVSGTPTAAQSVEHWQDHLSYVEQLYATISGNSDPAFLQQMNASALMFFPPGPQAQQQAYAGTYTDPASGQRVPHGFTIQTGGADERFYCLFDHNVENPWRPGTHGPLDEDLTNTAFVRIPGLPPLGKIGVHGQIPDCYQDSSLPSYQRMFLQEFLERLYREYTGAQDRVWTFGWHEHLFDLFPTGHTGQGRELRQAARGMVDWLNERFIGRTTANGNPVARYATMTEVRDEFVGWEAEHPGASSFELTRHSADWDNYPYELKGLARELANAHYDAALLPPDSTLQVYRFQRCPSSLRGETQGYWAYQADGSSGCYEGASDRGEPAGNPLATTTVYVAWRDAADSQATDLTAYVGRHATAYDGVTGAFIGADDALSALPLGYRPVILRPGPAGPTPTPPAGYLMIPYNANYLWGPPARLSRAAEDQFVATLNRHLDLMDELGLVADYYFTGLATEKLAQWSPETVRRLLNSDHGVNYHGANRPPYPQLVDLVKGERWEEDVATAWTYEAQGINPATGAHVGGLATFRQAFGLGADSSEVFATGRFFEASILYVDKQLGARLAVGLRDNTGASRDDAWFLGVLNRPTQVGLPASGLARAAIQGRAADYLAHARSQLARLSGPMPLAVLPIHDHDFYADTAADQEKVWDLYEEVLRLGLELGLQPVTMRQLYDLVENGPAPVLSGQALTATAQRVVQTVEATGYPPEFLAPTGSPPYSLAEAFEGLAGALSSYRTRGRLPPEVDTRDLLGPTAYFTSSVTAAPIQADAILDAAVAVSAAITDRIPSRVMVGDLPVNAAEFLYLMAQEYLALTADAPAAATLRPVALLPLTAAQNQDADPLTRLQFWTFKPAIYRSAVPPSKARQLTYLPELRLNR